MMHEQREALKLFLRDWNRMIGDDPDTLILEDAVRLYQECRDLLIGIELAEERFKSRTDEIERLREALLKYCYCRHANEVCFCTEVAVNALELTP